MANSEDERTNVISESDRLLWVCRRNGTWWPGQILSLDQVPQSCMASRRSGTPVKLLGKEDVIVEWINIEKSKRVKAFRCSEFNACIENAKASADNFDKRPVKYARRGYAILDALQLEGEQNLEDKPQDEITELSSPLVPDEVDHKVEGSSKLISSSNLGHELSHYGVSSKDTNFEEQITRKRKMNSPNNPEGVEELGVGLASKRGSQVEAQSLGPQHYNDSGPDTTGAATAVILGTSIEPGSKPRDADSALVTAQRLLPYPESSPLPESCGGSLNLHDVTMEVQASYISQNVPFACAESGLNGHSIVAHPPNVEVLGDDLSSGVSKVKKSEDCVPLSQIFRQLKAALRC